FLYRPVRRIIEEREKADRAAAEAAETKAREADAARADYETKRAALDERYRKREADLHAATEKERAATMDAAQKQAEKLLADARDRVARERAEALGALRDQVAALALDLARTALAGPGDDLDAVTAHLDGLSDTELHDLRQDLDGGAKLVVASARALPPAEADRWRAALADRLGPAARIEFTEDPQLLGGVELRFPHATLAFSVADRLRRAATEIGA
ncbi:MAG: F0F1 ATP synthase subunit delta, partial [Rhodovulum sp.]